MVNIMNNMLLSFFITFIAGFSTMIGTLLIFINIKDKNKIIFYSLIFSSIIMLYLSVLDLIPASFNYISKIYNNYISVVIVAIYALFGGIFVRSIDKRNKNNNDLYKIGIISMFALILHNIPEGIITFVSSSWDLSLGIMFAISIALHNIPEGIAISIPIYYGKNNKKKAIIYTLIAALSEVLGAVFGLLFFSNINYYLFAIILSFTAGVMIYLSIFELFKESKKYHKKIPN